MIEIERKFLVLTDAYKKDATTSYAIKQGFLNSHAERTVRVRLKEDIGILTIKGKSSEDGLSRYEWEKEISFKDAEELFKLCEEGTIEKVRYIKCWPNRSSRSRRGTRRRWMLWTRRRKRSARTARTKRLSWR